MDKELLVEQGTVDCWWSRGQRIVGGAGDSGKLVEQGTGDKGHCFGGHNKLLWGGTEQRTLWE